MADFTYQPSHTTAMSQKPNKLRVKFGDNYDQRASDGINTNKKMYSLIFIGLTVVEANAIQLFLEGKDGRTSFTWDDPDGTEVTVICESWNKTWVTVVSRDMNMSFEEVVA